MTSEKIRLLERTYSTLPSERVGDVPDMTVVRPPFSALGKG